MSFSTISPKNLDVWTGEIPPKMTKPKTSRTLSTQKESKYIRSLGWETTESVVFDRAPSWRWYMDALAPRAERSEFCRNC